ncbi:hypothetical protein Trydic_g6523 [Trypoxylus dichotomus]
MQKSQLIRVISKAGKTDMIDIKSYRPMSFSRNAKTGSDYSAAILLAIRGAFDHACWSQIRSQLSRKKSPRSPAWMGNAYFSDREAVIEEAALIVSRRVVRGCPQGSRSGSGYWNILYDSVLELDLGEGYEIIVFVDETTLLVRGRQYFMLKGRANNAPAEILDWSSAVFLGNTWATFKLGDETISTVMRT